MSYTYDELTQAIKDYTDNTETSFVSHIPDFVRNAEERLFKNVQHSFFKRSAEITLTQNVSSYRLPVGTGSTYAEEEFLAPVSLMFTDSSTEDLEETYFLEQKDFTFVQDINVSTAATGKPTHYAIKNINKLADDDADNPATEILISPRPGTSLNGMKLTLQYVYRPLSLVDTDKDAVYQNIEGVTWLSKNAPRAMLFGSLVEAAIYLKSSAETLSIYEAQFQESLMSLKKLGESMEQQDEFRYGTIVREKP